MTLTVAQLRQRMGTLPRLDLAVAPTPLQDVPRLQAALGCGRFLLKRDDLTGLALGGNKARKLEWLIADALAQDADVIVSSAAAQSNMLRMTCAAARRCGLDIHLVMRGTGREPARGNLLLDHIFGADITFIDTTDPYSDLSVEAMQAVVAELKADGRRPYVLDMRYHSGALATLGYLWATMELAKQLAAREIEAASLVCSTGSGTTQAGLQLGCHLLGLPHTVLGVSVQKKAEEMVPRIREKMLACASLLSLDEEFRAEPAAEPVAGVEVDDRWIGEAYGLPTEAGIEAILLAARCEGILFDPVYSGKGLSGVIGNLREGSLAPDRPVVFVHTGGVPAIFAMEETILASCGTRSHIYEANRYANH